MQANLMQNQMSHGSRPRQDGTAFQESEPSGSYSELGDLFQNLDGHLRPGEPKSNRHIEKGAEDPAKESGHELAQRAPEKDKKVLRMIFDMITQDGVLNLQAKNIQQSPEAQGHQEMSSERIINFNSIFCKKVLSSNRFDSIVKLNLSSNKIQVIDGDFCKNLPNVQLLDLRANRIDEISQHIKAMVCIKILKLDKNELTRLPEELFDIKIMEELTFQ